jgi:hypothetical protein
MLTLQCTKVLTNVHLLSVYLYLISLTKTDYAVFPMSSKFNKACFILLERLINKMILAFIEYFKNSLLH